ncbi:uncharacterized protein LOC120784686 isoform X1 [Xiphias gladius]|uniref:uncharacterized protein LOC120784686 isoform X1 n=1 Tax=Xiphias gladius TaxID=8245 RepID=UPI001A9971AA|nr:uncharacterized protein LOC120784686 isoform X1 [Xiphias gladius]
MKKTFVCNDSMIITIPIGNLKDHGAGQLMPEKFQCVFRDPYKVFVIKGRPKPLGAAQAIAGVFLCILGLILDKMINMIYTLPSVLFVVCGMLSYAAGKAPHMYMAKLSFSLNIMSFFWSIAAFYISGIHLQTSPGYDSHSLMVLNGINGLVMSLLVVENLVALFLIYWLSKAVCRQHFNTLPIILLKQGDRDLKA